MKHIIAIMESTEMPEFLRRGSMDDGDCEAAAVRSVSDDESLSAEASNKDISLRKPAFEQKCGINVIVHADENNSDSDSSASNYSPHSEVVNGVSELSKDGISEEETKDTHFNMEPRNGVNKDEDSIDEFGDVGTEFSSQDFVPKTLRLKDEISESEDGGGGDCGDDDDDDDDSSSYTTVKNTVSDTTADNGLNEDSTNPKTNIIQEIAKANDHEIVEKKFSGEASKSELDNDDDENNDWQGRSTPENTSKPSIVEDYLSDENSSDKEVSKVFSDDESGGGKLADRQFKDLSSESSSESDTAKGEAPTDAKFKAIEKDISSEEDEEEATLEGKQLKEISEDNFSEDETAVGESLGDEVYETEKYNTSSEPHKDEISEDESIKSNVGEGIREDSFDRKPVSYDDIQHSSAEECEKTDASDEESDGDSSEYSSPQEDDSCNFDDHLKHSDDHISSSDSESCGKGSIGDSEEKSSHSHDFKCKKAECSLSPDRHKYKDVRQDKDESLSEDSFDDNILNSSSEDVKSQNYLPQDRICKANDAETEINKDECERTELRDIQTSVTPENERSNMASTDNARKEIHEGNTHQTNTEKTDCSSSVENEGNENDVDMPLYMKDLKCEIPEESSEVASDNSQKPKTVLETDLHGESVVESEDQEEEVLIEEENLGTQSSEDILKENVCDSSFIRKPEDVSDTCQDSCEEKLLQQEDKDNFSEHESSKHEDDRSSSGSDSEENHSIGKGCDGNGDSLSCVFNVSDDDRNTNSPFEILEDKEQKDLGMKTVNLPTVSQDNQSDNGSCSQVKVETSINVTQKDDGGPFSSGDESVANDESGNSIKDFVSLDEMCESKTSEDGNESEHARKTEVDSVENNDNLPRPQKETKADAVQEHPEECETTQSVLEVESKESDAGSRETTTGEVDFEGTVNDVQSDLHMESHSVENSRTISFEDNPVAILSCEQHDSSVITKEQVCVEDNVDTVSDGHQILPSSHLSVSELKDKADVGEVDSAGSAGHVSYEMDESEADNSKRSLLENDNPDNDSVDSTGHISSERDQSEADKLNRSLHGSNDPENELEVVPANTNERSLDCFDPVKSESPNHPENDDTVNDRKFSSDDTKLMDSKQEEKEEGEEEEAEKEELEDEAKEELEDEAKEELEDEAKEELEDEAKEELEDEGKEEVEGEGKEEAEGEGKEEVEGEGKEAVEGEGKEEAEEEEKEMVEGEEKEIVEGEEKEMVEGEEKEMVEGEKKEMVEGEEKEMVVEGEEKEKEEEDEDGEKDGGGGGEEEKVEAAANEEEEEKKTQEETKIVTTHEECDSASKSSSQNSVQEFVQKSSSPDISKENSPYVERLPCTEIPKDSAHETSEFKVELNEKQNKNVNENVMGQISQDTYSYSTTEESGNIDIHQDCSKDEEMDHIEENNSVNIANGLEISAENVASEHSTGVPVTSDDVGIQPENVETSTKIESPLTNGTDCQQTLGDSAMETDDLKDGLMEERKSDQGNIANDAQPDQIVKKASIAENLTANDCGSRGDQVNNDSRKRKLSSSPEDEPISKEGCSLQYKGFKKRILAQASMEVADEQMQQQQQHATLPKPEELQPDLADSYTTPLTEYAQYLGLQPIVKFKCYLCGETGFPSILSLQEHQSSCLKTSKTRPVSQQPAVPDTVTAEEAEGDSPAVGVTAATAAGPPDVSGTPSTNFRITRKVYLCSVCGTYYENWNLFLHMKEMHRRFICLFCLTMFTDAGMLATHLSGEHSVTDRLYDTQEGFRAEIADEACFLVCCDCERIFAHTDNFYEHVCPTAPSVEKNLPHQQTQEPKLLQKHRRQQQKQKEIEQSNQHVQGVCSLCGLRGAHFPTCRRASSNSNALTTLVDGSGAVTELSSPEGEQQSEKQQVAKTDTVKKRTGKGKATTKTLPSGDIDAEVDGDEDYDISHAASFCQINIHETPADKPKASDPSSSPMPVAKVTLKTKNIPTTVLSNNSATKKNFVSVVKQEPDTPGIHNELDQTPSDSAVLESQKPKKTAESTAVTSIKSGKRGASCSPVPTTEGKKPKFDQLKDHVKAPVEDTEEHRGQTSSPVPESDSSSSHSQDSDRLHINTQESESVDGQSCADEDDAAMKDAAKDSEATDADKMEECTTSEKQVTPASTKAQHPRHRTSESESESSGSANDIPSQKTEDSSSSSEAEVASSSEDRKQDPPPEDAAKQKSEDVSDDGGGTAEEPESGGEESSKDSPTLVVDEEAAEDKKENGSASSQPTTVAEGGEIQVAGDDVPALELTLEEQPEVMTLQALVKECVRVSCNSCVFCNHAKKIAVNGSQLALHLLAEHRFEPVVCTDTADLKPVPADGFTARLKEAVHNLRAAFFNTDSYDSTAEPSEASSAEQGDSSHVYDRSYECFHCHFVTTLHKELYVHNRKMHQKTILLCVMCKSNFYSYSELLCHICPGLYAPDADISFRCCLCTVDKLPSAFRLMVHLRKRHHACDVCLEATGDQQRLSNHVWKHKLHHLCYRCGIAYRNKPDITKHLFWKHGTESVLCKKCLQKKWPHVYHFCIPPTAFNCEECGTSFARAVALKVHRRLHSGDRPYTCEDCPDSFISRKLLARHRRLKHAPPEPVPPRPSSVEKNATAQREREYSAALETEASSVRDSEADRDESASENKVSASLDKRTDNQMTGGGEEQSDATVKKNKVMDVYDLPPLNLSSDSDDSDEPDTKDSKTVTSPAAVSAPEVKDSETEGKPEASVADSVVGEEEEPAPVQIIDGIWDNFKNYKASLERKEQEAAGVTTESHSTSQESYSASHAIEIIMSDHDYCLVSKPSNLGTVDHAGSGEGTGGGLISGGGPDVSDKIIEGDKDSGSNTDSSPETMEATDDGTRSKVVAADSVSAVSTSTGLRVSAGPEKTLTQLSDMGRSPVVATEAAPSVPSGTPPQPGNLSTTTSSKKRTKQARKRQKREGASSSSSSSSSDSDSSSCSCGTNCSCSSSSSSSSGSSSSSSDSDSSTSEGRRRQAARRERRRERARKKATAASASAAAGDAVPASTGDAAAEPMSRTPTANSVPVAPSDTERERADGVIHESDLETDETETDEDFYDQHPQRQANRLLAEKRNRLMLLAAVAPASNGTAQLAQQLQELNQQQQQQQQHQEQQHHQRQEEPQQQQQQQQQEQQQTQPVPHQQTLQQMQPQQHIRIGSGTVSGDSRKVRTRKRKRAVLSDARTGSASLARSAETVVRPLGSLQLTTYRDSSGVVTQAPIPESTSVSSATSAVRTTGGSGSEGESKRLSKRRRVPKRFYGDSSDEDGETPVTPQPKWRKTGSGGGSGSSGTATGASVGVPATPSHIPEPPHLPIRQQVTLPSAAALLSSARSVAAGRRPVEPVGHSSSSSSSSSSGSDDADSNYESASDGGGGGGGHSGVGGSSSGGVGVGSVTGARTGGTAGAEVDNSGNKNENLYCYCQCPYDEVSEMIACDGKDCQIEWFHFECVGIMVPPKGKWFCPDCRKKSSASRGGEYLLHA